MTPYDPTQTQQTQLPKVPSPQPDAVPGSAPPPKPPLALARGITGSMAPQGSAAAGIGQAKPLATATPSQPTQGPEAKEAARLQASKPGTQQIHNPFLRTLATVGDALASTFAPRLATVLPGTTLHHNMLLNQAEHGATGEQTAMDNASKRALEGAQTENQLSEAKNRPKAPKSDIHQIYASAVQDAIDRGEDPNADPKAQQALKALTSTTAKEPQEKEQLTSMLAEATRAAIKNGANPTEDPTVKQIIATMHASAKETSNQPKTLLEKAMADHPDWTAEQLRDFEAKHGNTPLEEQVINEHLQRVHPGETMALARQHTQPAPQRDPDVALDRETTRFAKSHEKNVADATSQLEKIADARAMINGSAEAQALGIPKVLTALVSGQGSGVRITQPELNAIGSARGISGSVEGFVNSLSGKGKLTSTQQKQLTDLLDGVQQRIQQKQQISENALEKINGSRSRDEIIKADAEARRALMAPPSTGGGGGGKTYTQANVDAAVKAGHGTAQQIEDAFKAKGYQKQ